MRFILFFFFLGASIVASAQDQFALCNDGEIWTIEQVHLRKHYEGKLPVPKVWPTWEKGQDSLQVFIEKEFKMAIDKASPIQRVSIEFVVDCEGRVGQVEVIGRDNWSAEPELKKIIESGKMIWNPAQDKKGNPVDCRQILIFSLTAESTRVKYFKQK